jgi:hypothetical protein
MSHRRLAVAFAFLASACASNVDGTGRDDRAVTASAPSCQAPIAPTPEGWEVLRLSTFSVAAPRDGLVVSQPTDSMVQLWSRERGTNLAAFERRDLVSLGEAAGAWKRVLGEGCTVAIESTTHRCDEATTMHASCGTDRTVDVLLVQRHGAVYATSCELQGGDAAICRHFLVSLRID